MKLPHMLVMRNSHEGMIWQAYRVENEKEVELLTKSARSNGFVVQKEPSDYTDETTPGWRTTQEWQDYINGRLSERAQGQKAVREILKNIRRDGPYWLGGYNDWLVSCFSLRSPSDLHGYTPIACWSECDAIQCHQWMVCTKDGAFHSDYLAGTSKRNGDGYGLYPVPSESLNYPPHIFDWIFKDVIPNHK